MTRTLRSPRSDRAQYAPASEAADLSRLLDPSYTRRPRSPTSSTQSSSPRSFAELSLPRVYVDHDGAMHDPDFRMFPALPTPARKESHSSHSTSSGRLSPLPLSPPPMMEYRRPSWEQTFGLVESPVMTTSSHSQGEDAEEHHHHRFFKCRSRRSSTPTSSMPSPRESFEEDYTYSSDDEEDDAPFPRTPEPNVQSSEQSTHKPAELSGKEAIKYHTKALQLSVQLGVFRAKRRWRERKSSPQPT